MRTLTLVAALALWAGPVLAEEDEEKGPWVGVESPDGRPDEPVMPAPAPVGPQPTPLEWLRYERALVGRNVVVPATDGTLVRTIEWREPVEVRVRTESGAALTPAEQAAIRDLALVCDRGAARDVSTRTEANGTFVVEYGCVRLQGVADQ